MRTNILAVAILALSVAGFSAAALQAGQPEHPAFAAATSVDGHLLPDRALTAEDLDGLGLDDLRFARNEIFARYGYIFRDEALAAYFSAKSWYSPHTRNTSEFTLSTVEHANVRLIQRMEAGVPAPPDQTATPARESILYETEHPLGTIVVDTTSRYLYLIEGDNMALRYQVAVGREGFSWRGTERVSRKAKWPDWRPPASMRQRQPNLPRFMPGGPDNPLGARALYLGDTLYRIHGTNEPATIGQPVSAGCIRMHNEDIKELFDRVELGASVVVM